MERGSLIYPFWGLDALHTVAYLDGHTAQDTATCSNTAGKRSDCSAGSAVSTVVIAVAVIPPPPPIPPLTIRFPKMTVLSAFKIYRRLPHYNSVRNSLSRYICQVHCNRLSLTLCELYNRQSSSLCNNDPFALNVQMFAFNALCRLQHAQLAQRIDMTIQSASVQPERHHVAVEVVTMGISQVSSQHHVRF
jgi:hypothetical protein